MSVPNSFSPTTQIQSSQVNANFSYLERDITVVDGTTDITIASSTAALMSQMTITDTYTTGQVVEICFSTRVLSTVANDAIRFDIRYDSTTIAVRRVYAVNADQAGVTNTNFFYTIPSGGSKTFEVYWRRESGTGTISNSPATNTVFEPRQFSVEIVKD